MYIYKYLANKYSRISTLQNQMILHYVTPKYRGKPHPKVPASQAFGI